MTEEKYEEIVTWLNENLEGKYEDTSFSHEFGTEYQGYWKADVPEDCPYSDEEIEEVIEDGYKFSFTVETPEYEDNLTIYLNKYEDCMFYQE